MQETISTYVFHKFFDFFTRMGRRSTHISQIKRWKQLYLLTTAGVVRPRSSSGELLIPFWSVFGGVFMKQWDYLCTPPGGQLLERKTCYDYSMGKPSVAR